jgi:hypothetical protein
MLLDSFALFTLATRQSCGNRPTKYESLLGSDIIFKLACLQAFRIISAILTPPLVRNYCYSPKFTRSYVAVCPPYSMQIESSE